MEKKYLLYWFVSLVEMANYFFKCIFERKVQLHSFYQTSRNSLMIDIAKIIMKSDIVCYSRTGFMDAILKDIIIS